MNIFNQPLDSLPYYDRDLDEHPHLTPQINSLLAIELRSLLPQTSNTSTSNLPTNLSHLPAPRPLPTHSALLHSELLRLEANKPIPAGTGLDSTRYSLPIPKEQDLTSVEAWSKAHESSLAQLEHTRLRNINGSLMSSLGSNAWRIQNFALENTVKRVENEAEEMKKTVEEVNRERKRTQEEGGVGLNRLEKRWTELVSDNMQLEIGCMALEVEVSQLQQRHEELKTRLQQQSIAA